MRWLYMILPFFPFMASSARADTYRFVDEQGVVHYTNRPKPGRDWQRVVPEPERHTLGPGNPRCPTCDIVPARDSSLSRFTRYDRFIEEASRMYQIPVPLIKAVIKAESDFDPRVVSYKSARGLMQLIPVVEQEMGVKNVFDPRENILGGTRLLRTNANQFRGDLILTVAAYHAGPNAVRRFGGIPPYPSTRAYVRAVLEYYQYFNAQGGGRGRGR